MTFDPFQTSSGLALEDGEIIRITDAVFAFDPDYNNGESLVCKMTYTIDGQEGEAREQFFPVGNAWTTDDGTEAVRADGKEKGFGDRSAIGCLLDSLMERGGLEDGQARYADEDLHPLMAAWWIGAHFTTDTMEVDFKGEIGIITRIVAAEDGWIGFDTGKAASGKGAAKGAAKGKPAAKGAKGGAAKAPVPVSDGLDADTLKALDAMADAATEHDDFMEAVLASEYATVDGVADAIADAESDDGIWLRAFARWEASKG